MLVRNTAAARERFFMHNEAKQGGGGRAERAFSAFPPEIVLQLLTPHCAVWLQTHFAPHS